MNKNAITLLEVLIVIVIIAILAAIAVPNFTGKIERTRGERAIANIELIASKCKDYYIKYGSLPPIPINGLNNINTTLHLELVDNNFIYDIRDPGYAYNAIQIRARRTTDNTQWIGYIIMVTNLNESWDINSTWQWTPS